MVVSRTINDRMWSESSPVMYLGNNGGGSSHYHRTEETVTYTTVIQQPPAAIGAPRTGDVQQPLLWGALILLTLSGSMIIVGKMKKYYC